MNSNFEYTTSLQYRVKNLSAKVESFESGKEYTKLKDKLKNTIQYFEREIAKLKRELANAHKETITVRKYWAEIIDEMEKEYKKTLFEKLRELKKVIKRNLELERQLACAIERYKKRNLEYYAIELEIVYHYVGERKVDL